MAGCGHCDTALAFVGNQVGRSDVCPKCGEDVRACRNCRHYDTAATKDCKEPFAEVPSDKDRANFCEFFQLGEGGRHEKESMATRRSAAEALFVKK